MYASLNDVLEFDIITSASHVTISMGEGATINGMGANDYRAQGSMNDSFRMFGVEFTLCKPLSYTPIIQLHTKTMAEMLSKLSGMVKGEMTIKYHDKGHNAHTFKIKF